LVKINPLYASEIERGRFIIGRIVNVLMLVDPLIFLGFPLQLIKLIHAAGLELTLIDELAIMLGPVHEVAFLRLVL